MVHVGVAPDPEAAQLRGDGEDAPEASAVSRTSGTVTAEEVTLDNPPPVAELVRTEPSSDESQAASGDALCLYLSALGRTPRAYRGPR